MTRPASLWPGELIEDHPVGSRTSTSRLSLLNPQAGSEHTPGSQQQPDQRRQRFSAADSSASQTPLFEESTAWPPNDWIRA